MFRLTFSTSLLSVSLTAACSAVDSPVAPTATDFAAAGTSITSEAGGSSWLAPLKQATAAFHNVDRATAAGYQGPDAGACVAGPAGAMGVHAVNPALIGDQAIDPLRPEVLLYELKNGGGFKLVGVEYFQTVLVRNKLTGAVSPWFQPTPWSPAEYELLGPKPSVFGQAFDGPMPGHEPGMPWHYDLHVWAWSTNPDGVFAPFNPRVSCGGSGGGHAH